MTFLNPLILIGLVAAGIPLLIHLFNFRRPQKVDFSSLVFLRELQETTMQRVRIKQWLLLILRTLAIAALVLAFARPTLRGSIAHVFGGDAETATVLVVDNSLSMKVRDVDGVLLEQAQRAAAEFTELFDVGDQVAILTTGQGGTALVGWLKTRAAIADEAERVGPSAAAMTLSDAIAEAGRMLASTNLVNREIFVLSDIQESRLGDSLTADFPAGVPVRLVKIGMQETANTAVTDVQIRSQIIETGRPVRVEAMLSNSGTEAAVSVLASVFLDGERSAQSEVRVPPNSTASVEFVVTPRRTGWLEGVVEIEDDSFQDDNRRYFALFVPETRRVLLAAGEGFRPTYIELALAAEVAPGRTRFEMETIPVRALSSERLADYDVVVLAGVSSLSTGQVSSISTYVAGGGGLLLFPSGGSESSATNAVLGRLGGGTIEGVLGEGPPTAAAVIEDADTEHPLFEGVFQEEEDDARGPRLEQLEVYRFAAYRSTSAAEVTVVRLSTGHAFVQEIPAGRGKVLFVASLPTPVWSELPVRGLFVPLLYRSLSYLSAGESPGGESLTIGGRVDIQLAGASESDLIEIVGQEDEAVPSQRPAFGGMVVTVGPEIASAGTYDLMVGDRLARKLSANIDPSESDLRTASVAAAAARLRGSSEVDIRGITTGVAGDESFAGSVETMRSGVELWNVFLGVALVILLAEMLVSRLWKPESAAA